jgi:hypothetical protein
MDSKYGYIDTAHLVVIPFMYDKANEFAEGLAAVQKGDKWGFVDPASVVVIPFRYNMVQDFIEGAAQVYLKKKWYYINKQGKKVPAPEPDN